MHAGPRDPRAAGRRTPSSPSSRAPWRQCHHNIGHPARAGREAGEGVEAVRAGAGDPERLAREHPESPDHASNLGGTLNNMAMIDHGRRADSTRPATAHAGRSSGSGRPWPPNPPSRATGSSLANHLTNLIAAADGLGDAEGVAEADRELAERSAIRTRRSSALDARLAAIIQGDQQPKDNAERLHSRNGPTTRPCTRPPPGSGPRPWRPTRSSATTARPSIATTPPAPPRWPARGKGKDDPSPDDAARAKLRKQALDWLKAELSAWKRVSMIGEPGNKEARRQDTRPTGSRTPTSPASATTRSSPSSPRASRRNGNRSGPMSTLS